MGCWQGNKAETKTIIPMVTDFLKAHDVDPCGVVEVTITAQPQITAEAADIITAVQLPGH